MPARPAALRTLWLWSPRVTNPGAQPHPAPGSDRGKAAPAPHSWIEEATIASLLAAMASGERTSKAITRAYLERIEFAIARSVLS